MGYNPSSLRWEGSRHVPKDVRVALTSEVVEKRYRCGQLYLLGSTNIRLICG